MKQLHLLGHNHVWAIDAYDKHKIGHGFVISAFSTPRESVAPLITKIKELAGNPEVLLDLEFFGSKQTIGKNLKTYEFHPGNLDDETVTSVGVRDSVLKGEDLQIELGLKTIIVPSAAGLDTEIVLKDVRSFSKILQQRKETRWQGRKFLYSLVLDLSSLENEAKLESLLIGLTDQSSSFDGYYIVCDVPVPFRRKISTAYGYLSGLTRLLSTLNAQKMETVWSHANWDAALFCSITNISAVTLGTWENLRRFSIKRFTETVSGGPSDGWYFSETLLNFIRAGEISRLRAKGCLPLVANKNNVFSDAILKESFGWSNTKPEVHKNYLVAISTLLSEISSISDKGERLRYFESLVEKGRDVYLQLREEYRVFLLDENSDYHLADWLAFLKERGQD